MTKLIPAWPFVIMSEENVIIQVLETVPAERVFAVLTHHLSTAFIALDVNPAHRTLLNGSLSICPKERPLLCGHDERLVVFAGDPRMPSILATGAEFQVA